jgi:Zn-finger nucleic acid-binding protein
MNCPQCGHRMYNKVEDGYSIDYCPNCGYQEPPMKIG